MFSNLFALLVKALVLLVLCVFLVSNDANGVAHIWAFVC